MSRATQKGVNPPMTDSAPSRSWRRSVTVAPSIVTRPILISGRSSTVRFHSPGIRSATPAERLWGLHQSVFFEGQLDRWLSGGHSISDDRPTPIHERKHGHRPSATLGCRQNRTPTVHEPKLWSIGVAFSGWSLHSCAPVRRLSRFYSRPECNQSTSIDGVLSANRWRDESELEVKPRGQDQELVVRTPQGGEAHAEGM